MARATLLGTAIEWYDFNIYGAAAALVFGPQYFPSFSPVAATLAAFSTFAVGFIARPVGGIVFGHFGDRLGRKRMLVVSLLLMGIGTFLVALLPTHTQIGVAAPIALVVLRFVQGLGVGGEWGGAVLMSLEHAPENRRGWYASFPQIGLPAGSLTANVVFLTLLTTLGHEQFTAWGWRVPFLLSAVLVAVALGIRLRLTESPEFVATRRSGDVRRLPVIEVLRRMPGVVLLGMGVSLAPSAFGYLFSVFLLSYGTEHANIPERTMLLTIVAGTALYLVLTILFARLSDRVGPVRIYVAGVGLGMVLPFVVFALVDTGSVNATLGAMLLMGVIVGLVAPVQAILVSRIFPVAVRYSGASMSYQFGAVLGGGLTPVIAATVLAGTGTAQAVAAYMAVLAVISAVAVFVLTRVRHRTGAN